MFLLHVYNAGYFDLRCVAGLQELRVVVVVFLVGCRFLKCAPIDLTAAGPHPNVALDSIHYGTQTKEYGRHLGFSDGPKTSGL